jgi:hypothetical protein
MAIPGQALMLVESELALEILQDAKIVERVDLARDRNPDRARRGPA